MVKKQIAPTLILLIILTSSIPIIPMAPPAVGETASEQQPAISEAPAQPGGVVWSEHTMKPRHVAEAWGHVYVTSYGNYTFTGDGSVLSYASRDGENQVSRSYFWVNATGAGDFDERRNTMITIMNDTVFTVEYDVVDSRGEPIGRMSVTWRFSADAKPKGTASYTPQIKLGDFNVVWMIEPSLPILRVGGEVVDLSSASPRPLRVADRRIEFGRDMGSEDSSSCVCDWEDLGVDATVEAPLNGAHHITVYFPKGMRLIDPSIVTTSTTKYATDYAAQRKTFIANGYYWAFYSNGTHLVYGTSRNGGNWTQPTKVTNCQRGYVFSVCLNDSYVCYTLTAGQYVYFRRGLITDDAITWETTRTVKNADPDWVYYPSIAVDSNGYPWVAWSQKDSNDYYRLKAAKATSKTGTAWTEYNVRYNILGKMPTILPLTGGKMYVLCGEGSSRPIVGYLWSGSSWGSAETASGAYNCASFVVYSAASTGDTVHLSYRDAGNDIRYNKRTYGVGWGTPEVIASAQGATYPALSVDVSTGDLRCLWFSSNTLYLKKRGSSGWDASASTPFGTSFTSPSASSLTCFLRSWSDNVGVMWVEGSASPYSIKYDKVSTLDLAATAASGDSPLFTTFTGATHLTSDEAQPVTYTWDLDGDGSYEYSNASTTTVTHTYNVNATTSIPVSLMVTHTDGIESTKKITIQASPVDSAKWYDVKPLGPAGIALRRNGSIYAFNDYDWMKLNLKLDGTNHTSVAFSSASNGDPTVTYWFQNNRVNVSVVYQQDKGARLTYTGDLGAAALTTNGVGTRGFLGSDVNSTRCGDLMFEYVNDPVESGQVFTTTSNVQGAFSIEAYAGADQDPWRDQGLTPYGAYFKSLSEYVNMMTGHLTVTQTDLSLPGRELDLVIRRIHTPPAVMRDTNKPLTAGLDAYQDYTWAPMGNGWSLGLPWIEFTGGKESYIHLANGQRYRWRGTGTTGTGSTNGRRYTDGDHFKLYKDAGGHLQLYAADGVCYEFNTKVQGYRLLTIKGTARYANGTASNVISFTYQNDKIQRITDTIGRELVFSYDPAKGTVSNITQSSGGWSRTVTYTYGGSVSNGYNLTSVTDPDGRVTRFNYTRNYLIKRVEYPTGGATDYTYTTYSSSTQRKSRVLRQTIYASTGVVSSTRNHVYTGDFTLVSAVKLEEYEGGYTPGNLRKTTQIDNTEYGTRTRVYKGSATLVSDGAENVDASGAPVYVSRWVPGGIGKRQLYAYDNWGNRVYVCDPENHSRYYSYNNTSTSRRFVNSVLVTVNLFTNSFYTGSVNYNIHDRLIGEAELQSKGVSVETYHNLDSTGSMTASKRLLGTSTWVTESYSCDVYGNMVQSVDPRGGRTNYTYSQTYSTAYLTSLKRPLAGFNATRSFSYNFETGLLTRVTDEKGNATDYAYDVLGRVTNATYPSTGGARAGKGVVYDDSHNVATMVDERGNVTGSIYDGLGRLVRTERFLGGSSYSNVTQTYNWQGQVRNVTDAGGHTTCFAYDVLGERLNVTNPDGSLSRVIIDYGKLTRTVLDEVGRKRVLVYDRCDRLVEVREYYSASAYYVTRYTYDGVGNLVRVRDALGKETRYSYDRLNRLMRVDYPDVKYERKGYDANGNLAWFSDRKRCNTTYTYDGLNRLVNVTYPGGAKTTYGYDLVGNRVCSSWNGTVESSVFDARNRMIGEGFTVSGSSYSVGYGFDDAGNVVEVTYPDATRVGYGVDALGRVTSVGGYADFTYTRDGGVDSITYGNGVVTDYSYDTRDRPSQIRVYLGGTTLLNCTYVYDVSGSVTQIRNSTSTETYGYDLLDRLTSTTGPWGSIAYTYDAAGNMLSKGSTTYTVNATMNRVIKVGASDDYSYDANGNLIRREAGASHWDYAYDGGNRLTTVMYNDAVQRRYAYDADGRRVRSYGGASGNMRTIYSGLNVVYEVPDGGGAATLRFYAGGQQVAKKTGSWVTYLHQDHLGSTRLETDASSVIPFRGNYQPYGVDYGTRGSEVFRYTGKPSDDATGLYYFGARYYDPSIARFITEDIIKGYLSDPQSKNRYAYCINNPMKFTDPTGLWMVQFGLNVGGGIGLGGSIGFGIAFGQNSFGEWQGGFYGEISYGLVIGAEGDISFESAYSPTADSINEVGGTSIETTAGITATPLSGSIGVSYPESENIIDVEKPTVTGSIGLGAGLVFNVQIVRTHTFVIPLPRQNVEDRWWEEPSPPETPFLP